MQAAIKGESVALITFRDIDDLVHCVPPVVPALHCPGMYRITFIDGWSQGVKWIILHLVGLFRDYSGMLSVDLLGAIWKRTQFA